MQAQYVVYNATHTTTNGIKHIKYRLANKSSLQAHSVNNLFCRAYNRIIRTRKIKGGDTVNGTL